MTATAYGRKPIEARIVSGFSSPLLGKLPIATGEEDRHAVIR
jgi:hypothetical protein